MKMTTKENLFAQIMHDADLDNTENLSAISTKNLCLMYNDEMSILQKIKVIEDLYETMNSLIDEIVEEVEENGGDEDEIVIPIHILNSAGIEDYEQLIAVVDDDYKILVSTAEKFAKIYDISAFIMDMFVCSEVNLSDFAELIMIQEGFVD